MTHSITDLRILAKTVVFSAIFFFAVIQGVHAQVPNANLTATPNPVNLSINNPYPVSVTLFSDGVSDCADWDVFAADGVTPIAWPAGFFLPGGTIANYNWPSVLISQSIWIKASCIPNNAADYAIIPLALFIEATTPPSLPPTVDVQPVPAVTVNPTGTANVTVDISGVDYCDLTATDSGGNPIVVTGWTTATPLVVTGLTQFIRTITISGDVDITADCRNSGTDSDSDTEFIDTKVPAAVSVILTPTPAATTNIAPGSNFTINLTQDEADSCTLSSSNPALHTGWSNTNPNPFAPNASQNYNVTIYGGVTLTATCRRNVIVGPYDQASDSLTFSTAGVGVDVEVLNEALNTTFVANAVAGTYNQVSARFRYRNIGDVDLNMPEVQNYMVLNQLQANLATVQPGLVSSLTTAAGGSLPFETRRPSTQQLLALRGTVSFPPNGETSAYTNTRTFNVGIPFGTHEYCVNGARSQGSTIFVNGDESFASWDVDTSNNTKCFYASLPVPPPPMTLSVDKRLVRVDETVTIDWDADVAYNLECTLKGPGGVNEGPVNFRTSDLQVTLTGPLTSTSKFVFECIEPATNTSFVEDVIVEVTPDFEEI